MEISPKKLNRKFTYKDYLSLPEGERWELINGEAYDMSPAPSRRHQDITGALFVLLKNYLKGKECRATRLPLTYVFPAGLRRTRMWRL